MIAVADSPEEALGRAEAAATRLQVEVEEPRDESRGPRWSGKGYDADRRARSSTWRDRIVGDPRGRWADELRSRLADGARVLELGCGAGVPDTQLLAERFGSPAWTSPHEQIERARANVPCGELHPGRLHELELDAGSFEAVAAFYSFNHVPRDLLASCSGASRAGSFPRGFSSTALGVSDTEGWIGDLAGCSDVLLELPARDEPAFFCARPASSFELDEVVTFLEPEGEASFQWVLARR